MSDNEEVEEEFHVWVPTPEQLEAIKDLVATLPEEVLETVDLDWLEEQE